MVLEKDNILKTTVTIFLLSCVFFSFVTYNININNLYVLKYLTLSEVFGIMAISFFLLNNLKNTFLLIKHNFVFTASLLLLTSFSLGIFVTKDLKATLLALIIFAYLILLSIAIVITFKSNFLLLIKTIIVTFIIMSVVGFYDYFALKNNFLTIFPNTSNNYIISGFRYFGQTGDYSFMLLSFLLPYQFSNLSTLLSKKWFIALRIATFLGVIVLIGTGRVSAILSLGIGIFLWIILTRKWEFFKKHRLELILFFIIILSAKYTLPDIYKNVTSRYESRVSNRVDNTLESEFIVNNFTFAITSFKDKPLLGHGLASIANPTDDSEIHGTYLKILGETGIFGTLFYVFFIGSIFLLIVKKIRDKASTSNHFFVHYLPFFIASIIIWSYEYHLRKKEFWIILAVLLIISELKKNELKDIALQNE